MKWCILCQSESAEFEERFNEVEGAYYYNRRRVWTNGARRLEIYYSTRFSPGRWVISNGSYHLMVDLDQLLYDDGLDGGTNHSFPGLSCSHTETVRVDTHSLSNHPDIH